MRGCRAGCARTPGGNHTAIAPTTTAYSYSLLQPNITQEYTPPITSYCLQIIQMIAIAIAIIIATPAFVLVLLLLKLVGVLANSTSNFNFNPQQQQCDCCHSY